MSPTIELTRNLVLNDLVRSVYGVLDSERDPERVSSTIARVLRPCLGNPRLLDPAQCEPDPTRYRQHILYADGAGAFSIVALVWLPGQSTCIHDHVSWCAVGIHQGREREVQYELLEEPEGTYLTYVGECTNDKGSVASLTPPGDIHTVYNPGPETAISIHIYGADVRQLGTSIRRRYDHPVIEAVPIPAWRVGAV